MYTHSLEGRNIRLLRLLPGKPDKPILVSLSYASLDDPPPYEALSYVWGDASITEPIFCDGIRTEVTINLANALRRLRQRVALSASKAEPTETAATVHEPRHSHPATVAPCDLLWIDALCIDQRDILERNRQVSMMGDIYAVATRVIIWLGDADIKEEDERTVIVVMGFLTRRFALRIAEDESGTRMSHWDVREDFEKTTPNEVAQQMRERGFPDIWRSLNVMLSSQWFDRIWCVQEYLRAQQLLVLLPTVEFPGMSLEILCLWLGHKLERRTRGVHHPPSQHRKMMERISSSALVLKLDNRNLHPATILVMCASLQASDPRDKIYGIKGIMKPGFFEPDYSKSIRDVYIDATVRMMDPDLRVLSRVHHFVDYKTPQGYPSWVSSWDEDTVHASVTYHKEDITISASHHEEIYFAGPRRDWAVDQELARSGLLRLCGVSCGTIVDITYLETNYVDRASSWRDSHNFPDVQKAFRKLWCRTHDWETWDSPSLVELALTLTGGMIDIDSSADNIVRHTAEVSQNSMFNFLAFAAFMLGSERTLYMIGDRMEYEVLARHNCRYSWIFHTSRDWLCMGPRCAKTGDLLVVLDNGPTPYILRPVSDDASKFILVGPCFVYHLARGQINDLMGKDGFEERTFDLI